MAKKIYKPEAIVNRLRQVEVAIVKRAWHRCSRLAPFFAGSACLHISHARRLTNAVCFRYTVFGGKS